MSYNINIQGTQISLPSSSESPNWSSGIIQAFQAIANALSFAVGPYDISPQVYDISAFNSVSNQSVTGLTFSNASVRGAIIRYSVFRTSTATTVAETGMIDIVYDPGNTTGHKWEISREYTGNASITFSISDTGQIQFSTTSIGGTSHQGKISFAAQALTQS